ncbi:MAG: hypothetical protein L0H15_10150 [Nitrosospira sp.]|nr:hypothetical protein [Nitrosospira sp.]
MSQDDYEFLKLLLRPFEGEAFDPGLVDMEQLSRAVGHSNEDIRTASLYLMDNFVEVNWVAIAEILEKSIHSEDVLSIRTTAQFLAYCDPRWTIKFFYLQIELRQQHTQDEETKRLLEPIYNKWLERSMEQGYAEMNPAFERNTM